MLHIFECLQFGEIHLKMPSSYCSLTHGKRYEINRRFSNISGFMKTYGSDSGGRSDRLFFSVQLPPRRSPLQDARLLGHQTRGVLELLQPGFADVVGGGADRHGADVLLAFVRGVLEDFVLPLPIAVATRVLVGAMPENKKE